MNGSVSPKARRLLSARRPDFRLDHGAVSSCTTKMIPATAMSSRRTTMTMVVAGRNCVFRVAGDWEDTHIGQHTMRPPTGGLI